MPPRVRLLRLALATVAAVAAFAIPASAQESAQGPPGASEEVANGAPAPAGDGDASMSKEPTMVTLRAGDTRVPAGRAVAFTGRRSPGVRGRAVELQYRPEGGKYRTVDTAPTDRRGAFELEASPERSGAFRASTVDESGEGTVTSEAVEVTAASKLRIHARKHQLRRRGLRVGGRLEPHRADRRIVLQRLTGKGWQTEDSSRTGADGRYRIRWGGAGLGGYRVRTVFRGSQSLEGDRAELDHPIYMYRKDEASYFGPGFYGNQTACGQTLRRDTMGVAHKTLPCGTRVRFHYRDKTRKVKVIDRGPYVDGRRWDLTNATRRALDFPRGVAQIWATK